jgi:hypothetical protein
LLRNKYLRSKSLVKVEWEQAESHFFVRIYEGEARLYFFALEPSKLVMDGKRGSRKIGGRKFKIA